MYQEFGTLENYLPSTIAPSTSEYGCSEFTYLYNLCLNLEFLLRLFFLLVDVCFVKLFPRSLVDISMGCWVVITLNVPFAVVSVDIVDKDLNEFPNFILKIVYNFSILLYLRLYSETIRSISFKKFGLTC